MDLPRISASKINAHRRCKRISYYQLVEGIYPPSHPAAELGTEVHDLVQGWMVSAQEPPDSKAGRIATALIARLPNERVQPKDIERHLQLERRGVRFSGRIDWWEEERGRVTDFKTTSDFKWAKSAEELVVDPQSVIYSADRLGSRDSVRFRHLTVRTRPPHYVRETEILTGRPQIERAIDALIDEDVFGPGGIAETIQATDVSQVEPTLTACSAYGGCHYRTTCAASGVSTMGALSSIFSQTRDSRRNHKEDTMKALVPKKAKRATLAPKPSASPETPREDGSEPYTFFDGDHALFSADFVDDQAARTHAVKTTKELGIRVTSIKKGREEIPAPIPPSPVSPTAAQRLFAHAINPPAPEPEDAKAAEEMSQQSEKREEEARQEVAKRESDTKEGDVRRWTRDQLREWLEAHAPTVFSVGGRKPYKWKKQELLEAVEVVHRDTGIALEWATKKSAPVAAEPSVDHRVEEALRVCREHQPKRLALYINASPHGEPFVRLETIVADLMDRVSAARAGNEGEGDFSGHYLTIPYGQGPARVAALLKLQARSLTGNVVVDTRSPCAAACLEVLIPLAKTLVRGF